MNVFGILIQQQTSLLHWNNPTCPRFPVALFLYLFAHNERNLKCGGTQLFLQALGGMTSTPSEKYFRIGS
jgi:hypothetical protein